MSTDELTGVQALERKHPGLPLAPGKVERREFEYIRHGTRSFIISRDVVTGQIVEPYGGPRRTDAVLGRTFFSMWRQWSPAIGRPSGGILWWTTWTRTVLNL